MKSDQCTISVIIPVYNVEQYLEDCINSILGQSYSDLQIILIDDGSEDISGELCDRFAERDKRIQVIHQKNQGVAVARNTGLQIARGSYIGFVDPDDVIHPRMYEFLLQALNNNNADVAICHELAFEGENCAFSDYSEMHIEDVENTQQLVAHFMDDWTGPVNFVWNKLYKRDILRDLQFPIGRLMEDVYFSADALCRVSKAVWIKECLYGYRQRKGSIMKSENPDVYKFWAESILHQRDVIQKLGSHNLSIQFDAYTLRVLANLQLQAQKAGLNQGKETVRQLFLKLYQHVDIRNLSLKDKCNIIMARYCWSVYKLLHSLI